MLDRFKSFLSFQKIDKKAFAKYKYDIQTYNLKSMRAISFIGMMIALGLVMLCLPPFQILHLLQGYSAIAILFILLFLICFFYLENHLDYVIYFYYILIIVSLSVSIALGTYFDPRMPATSFVMFVIVFPLFIIDDPVRLDIVVGIMCIAFLICAHIYKTGLPLSMDIGNCIVFYLISIAAARQSIASKTSDIIVKQTLISKADIDMLTNLYNRGALEKRAMGFLNENDTTASVIVMDMDNFKYINDTYGHDVGDEALVKVGDLLKSLFRGDDIICRFGGDEFIIFLPGLEDQKLLEAKAETILKELDKLRLSADPSYRFGLCIGIATYPKDGTDYEALFKAADSAMFNVKKLGKGGYRFYSIQENQTKKMIIIADDVELNRVILHNNLEEDYNVLVATNGKEVLDLLGKHEEAELVITDIQMPVMDGYELVREMKANAQYRHKAIIAYTSYEDEKQEEELYKLGVDDFIYKAAAPPAMKLRVKNVLKVKGLS